MLPAAGATSDLPPGVAGVSVVDLERVVRIVQASLERAVSTGWPVLPVVRDGWICVP